MNDPNERIITELDGVTIFAAGVLFGFFTCGALACLLIEGCQLT